MWLAGSVRFLVRKIGGVHEVFACQQPSSTGARARCRHVARQILGV
jgi:hypothetical protein